jgi:sugar lactone lactonase YvrE
MVAYGKTIDNHTVKVNNVTWTIDKVLLVNTDGSYSEITNNNNATINSYGIFTGKHPGPSDSRSIMDVVIKAKLNDQTVTTTDVFVTAGSINVTGKVTSGGNPVSGAKVQVALTPYYAKTDANGDYFLSFVPAGRKLIVNSQYGDQTGSTAINDDVPVGGTATVNISLNTNSSKYVYEGTIGTTSFNGIDNAHFYEPDDIAFDSKGNFYVSDTANHRVQKFDSSNKYLATIGKTGVYGTDNKSFIGPVGLAVNDKDELFVCDMGNHRIQKFDSTGNYMKTFGVTGLKGTDNSHFNSPQGIAVDGNGNIYISDTDNYRVQKLDSGGNYIFTIGETGVPGTDNNHFGRFIGPTYIKTDREGNIFVADSSPNSRVQIFDLSGKWKKTMGETGVTGTDNSHFNVTAGLSIDSSGNIYVVDHFNERVQIFDQYFAYSGTIGVTGFEGSSNDKFRGPMGIGISPSGKVYVVDTGNQRVQIFRK